MKRIIRLLLIATILSAPCSLWSQSRTPITGKEPAWVTLTTVDYSNTSLDKDAEDGYIDVGFEKQVSLAEQSVYEKRTNRIISTAGVQNASEVSVSFDPSYQQLIFHTIRIIRDGKSINRLQLSKIKIIQQEKELSNYIYNGSLDAVLFLDDVRKGDIIEYSYTTKGFNPIFKGRYADEYSTGTGTPLYHLYYKLLVPAGRKINVKNCNETINPVITTVNGQQVYEWKKGNIAATHTQDFMPSWYEPYPSVTVSEFNNWKEVNDWAMELFPLNKPLSPAIQKKVAEIQETATTDEKRVLAALRFVQDDIRYMGIEMGEHSHKPADPSKVFAQRFGDCKEKSYLLCCMLNAMHITAEPVLINTDDKHSLNNWLPAPTSFDHATVRVTLGKETYFLDPTIASQRGSLKDIFYPDYQVGLVISPATTALTPIPFHNNSTHDVKEVFSVKQMQGSGTLVVTTTLTGSYADDTRDDFHSNSIGEMMDQYRKFYAEWYDQIKADSLTYTDNDSTGVFTTKEYYTLPDFWTIEKGNVKKFSFEPFLIGNTLRRPKEHNRSMPFRLIYPARYKEQVVVYLPENWDVKSGEMHLHNSNYTYNSKFYNVGNTVFMDADYENTKDHVTPTEAPAYFADLKTFDDKENFELTYGLDDVVHKDNTHDASTNNMILTIVIMVVLVGGLIWWSQRR